MADSFQPSIKATSYSIAQIAKHLNARIIGDDSQMITAINSLADALPGEISFLSDKRLQTQLKTTQASAVLLSEAAAEHCPVTAIIVDNPYAAYARAATLLYPQHFHIPGIHPEAIVDDNATIDITAWIGPGTVIEANAVIEADAQIGPNCVIGKNVRIGKETTLVASVTITYDCQLGERNLIHPGVVIGSDGFGQANDNGKWLKIPQLGRVIIGDDVEIGSNTTIDRGAIKDTVIENGVRLDNLIQIAHNVHIGADMVMAAQSGISGSTSIGKHCMFGGAVSIAGHLDIADNVILTGRAGVRQSIDEAGIYGSGTPLEPVKKWMKNAVRFKQLDEMSKRISELEKKLAQKEEK
ncbi:UDP-3-O-[3-hydroxymyristoyl] glucosamine N-acyltransferase [hydrothermal vent metagenome]|uniref:UDP-3-O-[3-hydroxymyristoyl] glucosamine N-acyltransferase n=1 Tax=hydrothermal vent metagenome TaxID=652676 RepID=A0A3B1AJS5_9ZZZZ